MIETLPLLAAQIGGLHPSLVLLKDRNVSHTTTTCVTIGY
jgi:hypothetical protein